MPAVDNLEKLTLTLQPDGYEYQMYPVTETDEDQSKPAFSISPPGVSARDNVLLGVQGQTNDITLNFAIWDDGTDRAGGTHTSTVVTLAEQINYLRDTIHAATFAKRWELDHTPGGQFSTKVYDADDVYLENLQLPTISETERKWKQATMRLRRGESA